MASTRNTSGYAILQAEPRNVLRLKGHRSAARIVTRALDSTSIQLTAAKASQTSDFETEKATDGAFESRHDVQTM